MGTIAAMATVAAGAHVVDRLKSEKVVTETDKCVFVNVYLSGDLVCVYILGAAACGSVH